MIRNKLPFVAAAATAAAAAFLAGCVLLPKQAWAQPYVTNHQQYFLFEDSRPLLDTKALTPVGNKRSKKKKFKWAFASTILEKSTKDLNILLVRLGENLPTSPFPYEFEWAFEYGLGDGGGSIDVEDVVYQSKGKTYVLCGTVTTTRGGGGGSNGFLLTVNKKGKVKSARVYDGVETFRSVVPRSDKDGGYIAVGRATPQVFGGGSTTSEAVYVSVDKNLGVVCARLFRGDFGDGFRGAEISTWNKVVPYGNKRNPRYAVAGTAEAEDFTQFRRKQSDVLVAVANESCDVDWFRQYGGSEPFYLERGLSLARFDPRKGGLVVTGSTRVDDDPIGVGGGVAHRRRTQATP